MILLNALGWSQSLTLTIHGSFSENEILFCATPFPESLKERLRRTGLSVGASS
jgi:hypothetical protein